MLELNSIIPSRSQLHQVRNSINLKCHDLFDICAFNHSSCVNGVFVKQVEKLAEMQEMIYERSVPFLAAEQFSVDSEPMPTSKDIVKQTQDGSNGYCFGGIKFLQYKEQHTKPLDSSIRSYTLTQVYSGIEKGTVCEDPNFSDMMRQMQTLNLISLYCSDGHTIDLHSSLESGSFCEMCLLPYCLHEHQCSTVLSKGLVESKFGCHIPIF
jgi:hypothetical protein